MTLPRPVLIALLGLALVGAALLGMRNARVAEEDGAASAAAPAAERQAPAPGRAELDSGRLAVRISATELRTERRTEEDFVLRFGGAFQARDGGMPQFDLRLSMRGAGEPSESFGAVSTGDAGYLLVGRRAYRVPAEGFSNLSLLRARIAQLASGAPAGDAPLAIDPRGWLTEPRRAPGPKVDGTATTRTTGTVDVKRAVGDLVRLLSAAGDDSRLPARTERAFVRSVRRARVSYDVGASDGIVRRARLDLDVRIPRSLREKPDDVHSARISVAVDLSGVNRAQRIVAPAGARELRIDQLDGTRHAPSTLLTLGVAVIDAPPGAERVDPSALQPDRATAPPSPLGDVRAGEGLPARVARGLRRGNVVVLAFVGDGGDDRATRAALRSLRGRRGVTVVTDHISAVSEYRRVVAGLGVNQAPAIVIVRRDGQAELLEGYVDGGTLVQEVRDAR